MQTKRIDVLDDLFSPAEAVLLRVKSNLLSQIVKAAKPHTQAKIAIILDEHQPRISKLMTGKVSEFSLDCLVLYAQKLGLKPRVELLQVLLIAKAWEEATQSDVRERFSIPDGTGHSI